MARPTLIVGSIWTAPLANASIRPFVSDEDVAGAIEPIRDEDLTNDPDNIKQNFYGWYDRCEISVGSGLALNYSSYGVRLINGTVLSQPSGTVFAIPESTSFVFLDVSGSVTVATALPISGVALAVVTANATEITAIVDLREQKLEQIRPISLPVTASPFVSGDVKPTFRTTPEPGWLFCQGQTLNTADYPSLATALGFSLGDSTFTIPDLRGRSLVGAGQGLGLTNRVLKSVGGLERVQLSSSEMPQHAHGTIDSGHSHGINDPGHSHPVFDPGHQHSLAPYKRATILPPTGTPGAEISAADKVIGSNIVNTQPTATGISIVVARSNVSALVATSNIQITNSGGNVSHENMQPYCAVNWAIKT